MSDIWNEFEKIAVEQGLIITAEEERKQEDPSKMPARYDSLSDDAIRLLYGVEPETIFEKNKTIIEIAHPETAVIGRAYDAMNAVVENLHQRQDMMAYIALKMPNGHLTQRRYVAAKQELINSLVRAAFLLDSKEEDTLVTLADSCTKDLVADNKMVKEAVPAIAVVGIIAGAGVIFGAANYFINGAPTAQNVYANSQIALKTLEPLMAEPYAQGIAGNIRELMKRTSQIYALKGPLSRIQSVSSAVNVAQTQSAAASRVHGQIQDYLRYLQAFYQAIPSWVQTIQRASKISQEKQSDWYARLTGALDYVWDDKEKTLVKALAGEKAWFGMGGQQGGLLEAVKNDIAAWSAQLQTGQSTAQQAVSQIAAVQPQQAVPVAAPAVTPAVTPAQPQGGYLIPGGLPQATPAPRTPGAARPAQPQGGYLIPGGLPQATPAPRTPGAARPAQPTTGFGGLPQW